MNTSLCAMKPTPSDIARAFGVPEANVRRQFARNVASLREDLAQAEKTGRKVRGYTAAQIRADIERFGKNS